MLLLSFMSMSWFIKMETYWLLKKKLFETKKKFSLSLQWSAFLRRWLLVRHRASNSGIPEAKAIRAEQATWPAEERDAEGAPFCFPHCISWSTAPSPADLLPRRREQGLLPRHKIGSNWMVDLARLGNYPPLNSFRCTSCIRLAIWVPAY